MPRGVARGSARNAVPARGSGRRLPRLPRPPDLRDSNAPVAVKEEAWRLLNRKRGGDELGLAEPNPILDQYIEDAIGVFALHVPDFRPHLGWDKLNNLFHYSMTMDGGNYEHH